MLRILLAPLNPRLGDIAHNAGLIRAARAEAARRGAGLLLLPQAALTGAPLEDLAGDPDFLSACEAGLTELAAGTADGGPGLLLGACWKEEGRLRDGAVLLDGGRILARRSRHLLPPEDPLGAPPRFHPGPAPGPIVFRGLRLGVMTGADATDPSVAETLLETGAELLVCLDAQAFDNGPPDRALDRAVARVVETGLPFLSLGLLGGQGDLLFPGGGFALNSDRELALRLPDFAGETALAEWRGDGEEPRCIPKPLPPVSTEAERLWRALRLGLGDAVGKGRFSGVLIDPAEGPAALLLAALVLEAPALGPIRLAGPIPADLAEAARRLGLVADAGVPAGPCLALSALDKTAMALGEGRLAGDFAPLRDLWRGQVADLAAMRGLPAPAADRDSDAILQALLRGEKGVDAIAAGGYDAARVRGLRLRLLGAEAGRRRAPPGLRLSGHAFGRDRRYPIVTLGHHGMTG